jgi:thiol-disulfide isomerase/thioredoxin
MKKPRMPKLTDDARIARVGFLAASLAVLVAGPLAGQSSGVSLALGTPGPEAELEDLEGNAVQLLDYVEPGKPAVLEFWATWCEQCEALQPQFDQLQVRYGAEVSIVAVAVGVSQSVRRVKRHLEDHDPGYPYLYDSRGAAVRAYNATTTSIVVMLDADGKVAYTGVGVDQDLLGAVEALLAR